MPRGFGQEQAKGLAYLDSLNKHAAVAAQIKGAYPGAVLLGMQRVDQEVVTPNQKPLAQEVPSLGQLLASLNKTDIQDGESFKEDVLARLLHKAYNLGTTRDVLSLIAWLRVNFFDQEEKSIFTFIKVFLKVKDYFDTVIPGHNIQTMSSWDELIQVITSHHEEQQALSLDQILSNTRPVDIFNGPGRFNRDLLLKLFDRADQEKNLLRLVRWLANDCQFYDIKTQEEQNPTEGDPEVFKAVLIYFEMYVSKEDDQATLTRLAMPQTWGALILYLEQKGYH